MLFLSIKYVNGKATPFGDTTRQFDGERALLIHLIDFSLWVTNSFAEEGLLIPLKEDPSKKLSAIYREQRVDPKEFSDLIDLYTVMYEAVHFSCSII